MNNLQLEMISNRIEKTYILFTLYKDLKSFFSETQASKISQKDKTK